MIVLLFSLLSCVSIGTAGAQTPPARFETRLSSLERRVANLEAAQTSALSPATTTSGPRTTEEIERVNIQAISPRANRADAESVGGTGGATGAGASTTSAA